MFMRTRALAAKAAGKRKAAAAAASAAGEDADLDADADSEFFDDDLAAAEGSGEAGGGGGGGRTAGGGGGGWRVLRPWLLLVPRLLALGYQVDVRFLQAAAYGAANMRMVRCWPAVVWVGLRAAKGGCGWGAVGAAACGAAHMAAAGFAAWVRPAAPLAVHVSVMPGGTSLCWPDPADLVALPRPLLCPAPVLTLAATPPPRHPAPRQRCWVLAADKGYELPQPPAPRYHCLWGAARWSSGEPSPRCHARCVPRAALPAAACSSAARPPADQLAGWLTRVPIPTACVTLLLCTLSQSAA